MVCTISRTTKGQIEELERQGFTIDSIKESRHMKFKVTTPQGTSMIITTAKTPSDWRVQKKFRSQLKRFARPIV